MSEEACTNPLPVSPKPSGNDATVTHTHERPIKSLRFSDSVQLKHQEVFGYGSGTCENNMKAPQTPPKDTNSDNRSDIILKSTETSAIACTDIAAKSNTTKGSCAKFLRENPRFLNEPICHVLPNESSRSVGDCLSWRCSMESPSTVATTIHGKNKKPIRSARDHSNVQ